MVERARRELASRSGVRYGVEPGLNETTPPSTLQATPRTAMDTTGQDLLGTGIYTVPEASRLVGVSCGRIRRWLRGYSFGVKAGTSHSPPVWGGQIAPSNGTLLLGFRDLLEMRFVDAFLRAGVTWPTLRRTHNRCSELLHSRHPFCTGHFKTDGCHILSSVRGEEPIFDVLSGQVYFEEFIRTALLGLEFSDNNLVRWWPLGEEHQVVIDPCRSFGRPILPIEGVPTDTLAHAVAAGSSPCNVCAWFDVPRESLADALEFEHLIAA